MRTSSTLRCAVAVMAVAMSAQTALGQGFFKRLFGGKTSAPATSGFAGSAVVAPVSERPAAPKGVAQQAVPQQAGTGAASTAPTQVPTPAAADALPQADEVTVGQPLQVQVNEVDLVFTVIDHKGHFVTGLKQENFGLLDDQRPPERVRQFVQQTNLPLRVGIMLDTSSSIRQRFAFEQEAATDFLLQVLHPADRAFVEGFDVQLNITQNFTNRIDLLDTGIHRLRPGGGTSMFDSLYTTCRDQMLTLKQDYAVRKAIVMVSDGDDDYSHAKESDAIKMCQRAETIVYTISTNVGPSKDKGDDVLKRIADSTGGQAFFPTRIEDVAQGFHNIEEELRSQYLLVYKPSNFKLDGAFRTIYLESLDSRYSVRAKKGYFAPKAE